MRRCCSTLLVFLAAAALAGPARAAVVVTLSGEQASGTGSTTLQCDLTGSGTATYSVVGVATGPYPGTYAETGTITFRDGGVESFHASFTIESGLTRITGTKDVGAGGTAFCRGTTGSPVDQTAVGNVFPRYEARIDSPTGTFTDRGVSGVGLGLDGLSGIGSVSEGFNSDREFAFVTLSPPGAIDDVGTTHTVTATVVDSLLHPIPGARVVFTVTGSVSASGSCVTDTSGSCDFTYAGPPLPGADLITACQDFDRSGSADAGEGCATATKVWILPVSAPGETTGGGYVSRVAGAGQIAFGFDAKSDGAKVKGECNVVDQVSGTQVKCLDVTSLAIVGRHATFSGEALVNGVAANYVIDVDDLAEPGDGRDVFKLATDRGYSVGGVLLGGNIQVHG
jgi:hypothetical protein